MKALTIYRKCECGETAHDYEGSRELGTGALVFVCRNCRKTRTTKAKRFVCLAGRCNCCGNVMPESERAKT